ncbi:S26 family signal peptidase [Embleya sp. NPDC050154]|uniref:S26 family signal peptidase n=1 Tax=unclassified Embleya TaxID=2699296 RepID=UPI0037878746
MNTRRMALAGAAAAGLGGASLVWMQRRYLVATVQGPSMEPTLSPGDRLLVRRTGRVRAGQVVVVRVPNPPLLAGLPPEIGGFGPEELAAIPERTDLAPAPEGRLMIKRAVAVAGDPIPRDRFPILRDVAADVVPTGAVVVLGDNPAASWDSRAYGFVHRHQVIGVAVRRIPAPGEARSARSGLARTTPAYENASGSRARAVDGERRRA